MKVYIIDDLKMWKTDSTLDALEVNEVKFENSKDFLMVQEQVVDVHRDEVCGFIHRLRDGVNVTASYVDDVVEIRNLQADCAVGS